MSRSGVNLYAEFLLNISQVTIFATLDLKGKDVDTAHFMSDRKRIEITYAGDKAAITYPNGISGTAVVHLPIKAAAHVSLRLEITEKGDPYWKNSLETLNDNPWSAGAFSTATSIACRQCKSIICEGGRIVAWKDLPRGDWAETMDLWHCHKPTEGTNLHSSGKTKDLDNAAVPVAHSGVAFIDSSDIVLSAEDITHFKKAQGNPDLLLCEACGKSLGSAGGNAEEGLRLHKWNLAIRTKDTQEWETNDIQSLLCVQLLELADSQASKRFVLESSDKQDTTKPLLVWVLNPDLKYCASYVGNGCPRRAMKVLYKDFVEADAAHTSDSSLSLPSDVLANVRRSLVDSTAMMPPAAREVQGWTAGLLDRFKSTSTEGLVAADLGGGDGDAASVAEHT